MKLSNKKGFTIVELLVSLAIIAMLFSITFTLLSGIRQKSRDARRMSDVREIKKALSLYANQNNKFPTSATETIITGNDIISVELEDDGVISETPVDPMHPTYSYAYQTDALGNTYIISFCLETNDIPNYSEGCANEITP